MADRYAVVAGGFVLEILGPVKVDGAQVEVADRFHPDFLAQCVKLSDSDKEVAPGWKFDEQKSTFTKPA